MQFSLRHPLAGTALVILLAGFAGEGDAATLVAQYDFNNTLASSVAGAPSLTAVDPTNTSGFVTDTVNGTTRTVYSVGGTNANASQGGLVFDNSGNLLTSNSYSIFLVLSFSDRDGAWRRILDVQDRQSDNGLYIDPSNKLDVYPVSSSTASFTNNTYHTVALTVATDGTVSGYLDYASQFTLNTTIMDINNAQNVVNLFLDNVVAGGQGEWSAAKIALASFYDGVLTGAEVQSINLDPFQPPSTDVPEPASLLVLGAGLLGLAGIRRRSARAA